MWPPPKAAQARCSFFLFMTVKRIRQLSTAALPQRGLCSGHTRPPQGCPGSEFHIACRGWSVCVCTHTPTRSTLLSQGGRRMLGVRGSAGASAGAEMSSLCLLSAA